MVASRVAPGSKQVLQGVIKTFDVQKGFGFITAEGGQEYFFHANNARTLQEQGGSVTFGQERDNRNPLPKDRVFFIPVPPRKPGERPQAVPWGFRDPEPRASVQAQRMGLLPMAPAAAQTPQLEPIDKIILRHGEGLPGIIIGLTGVALTQSEWMVRMFLEVALKGEALWQDYKRRLAAHAEGTYGWTNYVEAVVSENFHKIIGPKACLLPDGQKKLIWAEVLRSRGELTPADALGVYFALPAAMAKYESACRGCFKDECQFYKGNERRSGRR